VEILVLVLVAIVVLLVAGALLGVALMLLWWFLIGLVIGGLGRLLVPGPQDVGLLGTALVGIAGSLLGGVIAHAAGLSSVVQVLIAIGVSALLIVALGRRRSLRA